MAISRTVCGGNSQSYASGDWTTNVASPNAETYSGTLPTGKEIVCTFRDISKTYLADYVFRTS